MRMHTRDGSRQVATLTPEFIDHFAVVGPPERCLERLTGLAALGLDKKKDGQGAEAIPEDNAGEESDELEAKPEDFDCCNVCTRPLSEDEKIINARFVNEAIAASRDISVFPVCI